MEERSHFDLLVIGTGAAGLSSALGFIEAAAERGESPSVAVVERSSEQERGGATKGSWANLMVNPEGVVDPDVIQRVIDSHPEVDEAYFRTLEAAAGEAVDWLGKHGVTLDHTPTGFAMESTYRATVGGGQAIVEALTEAIERYPAASFHYETEAVRLRLNGVGRVDGVLVRGADGLLRVLSASSVVVACGGFEGNYEMLTRYVGPRAGEIVPVVPAVRNNVGDGLRMITEIGGDTAGQFDMLHVQLVDSRSSKPDAGIFGVPYGIIVNEAAERFVDEGSRTFEGLNESLAFEVWRNQNSAAYFIGDTQTFSIPGFEHLNQTDLAPVEAGTIPGLARGLGLDPEKLEATVSAFNSAVQDGTFDVSRCDGKRTTGLAIDKTNWARALSEGPFRAYPVKTAVTFSFGGVRTDVRARVLTPGGTPIPHLYAAGVATGVWYQEYPGALSVLRCVVFGRIAGREAAQAARP
ncbi:FAD-binding protein [Streptomyces sp. NPDC003442]